MSQLNGQVALVTGAEVGIGRATALELARDGADVAVHYYADQAAAGEVVREIEALGRRAAAFGADLTRSAEVTRAVGGAQARFGRIDILVNNAGGLLGRHSLPGDARGVLPRRHERQRADDVPVLPGGGAGHDRARLRRHRQPHVARRAQRRRARALRCTPPRRPPCSR